MNTPSNVVAESSLHPTAIASVEVSRIRSFYWAVRRELWELRSIYLAPLVVGALGLIGFLVAIYHLPAKSRLDPHAAIEQPLVIVALMLMVVDIVVAVFYSVDALYGERRDRSILFWNSLPVSDVTTVLAKASIPILVLPLITSAVTIVVQFLMLVSSSAVLAASGLSPALPWVQVSIFKTSGINLYHLIVFHGLWYAPFFGWFLLVSAWAKRAPFLWAVIPPVAIGLVEKIAFNTSHFGKMVLERFGGGPQPGGSPSGMSMDMLTPHHAVHFLFSPGMWGGLIFTALCLLAAVRLRRSRAAS
ncbi:MAG TPA: ABC transporter permease [Terriglobales bacterium]|nr:ABC transporter permease [Terriglobales bacterium]